MTEREQLEQAIAALEAQRASLGDAAVAALWERVTERRGVLGVIAMSERGSGSDMV